MSEVSQDQYSYSLIVVEKASEIEDSTLVESTRSCVLDDHGNDGAGELNKNQATSSRYSIDSSSAEEPISSQPGEKNSFQEADNSSIKPQSKSSSPESALDNLTSEDLNSSVPLERYVRYLLLCWYSCLQHFVSILFCLDRVIGRLLCKATKIILATKKALCGFWHLLWCLP